MQLKKFLSWAFARLLSQSGQIPNGDDATPDENAADQGQQATDTGDLQADASQGGGTQPEASFFDPRQIDNLPIDDAAKAQLRSTWKAMHGGYNKWIQTERNPLQQKAAVVDRFYSDPNFARATLVDWAGRNGFQLVPLGQQASNGQQPAPRQQGQVPAEFVEAAKQSLPPELQWMAESLAGSMYSMQQLAMKPLQERAQQQQQQQLDQAYEKAAADLREKAPDWEKREPEMSELWDFLTSQTMESPKFGNKLELLWNLLNGNQTAIADAAKRMQNAVKNRGSSSIGQTRTTSNLQDRIRQAPDKRTAFQLAAQDAMNRVG